MREELALLVTDTLAFIGHKPAPSPKKRVVKAPPPKPKEDLSEMEKLLGISLKGVVPTQSRPDIVVVCSGEATHPILHKLTQALSDKVQPAQLIDVEKESVPPAKIVLATKKAAHVDHQVLVDLEELQTNPQSKRTLWDEVVRLSHH